MRVQLLAGFFVVACGEKSDEQPCMEGYERSELGQCEPIDDGDEGTGNGTGTAEGSGGETDTGGGTGADGG